MDKNPSKNSEKNKKPIEHEYSIQKYENSVNKDINNKSSKNLSLNTSYNNNQNNINKPQSKNISLDNSKYEHIKNIKNVDMNKDSFKKSNYMQKSFENDSDVQKLDN